MSTHPWWYVARSTGVVAWILLAATTAGGATFSNRRARSAPKTLNLHRFLGGLAVLFVAAHIAALLADRFTNYGPSEILLPLASVWRPGPVAWGVVALYILIIVEASSLLFRHLPRRLWHRLHNLSYPLFQVATLHFLSAGTDVYRWSPPWLTIAIGCVLIGVAFWGWVLADRRTRDPSLQV